MNTTTNGTVATFKRGDRVRVDHEWGSEYGVVMADLGAHHDATLLVRFDDGTNYAVSPRTARMATTTARTEAHQPTMCRTPTGWAMGCSCGQDPGKRSARASMMHVWFAAHVKKLGLPRFVCVRDGNYGEPVYMDGPAKGLTWDEARARGISINGGALCGK